MLITNDMLNRAMNLDGYDLRCILWDSGYTGMSFKSAQYVGLTEKAEFVYDVTFHDEGGTGEIESGKVFVRVVLGKFLAEF